MNLADERGAGAASSTPARHSFYSSRRRAPTRTFPDRQAPTNIAAVLVHRWLLASASRRLFNTRLRSSPTAARTTRATPSQCTRKPNDVPTFEPRVHITSQFPELRDGAFIASCEPDEPMGNQRARPNAVLVMNLADERGAGAPDTRFC